MNASTHHVETQPPCSRRQVLTGLAGAALLPASAASLAADAAGPPGSARVAPLKLPLKLAGLIHHVGISVRDVIASASFYSRLVGGENVHGEKEPFLRYFIRLRPEGLGDVAIGKLGTLGSTGKTVPLIDHFCVDAVPYDDPAWRARLKAEGLTYLASGVFADPEGIPIQVAGGEGGESLSAGDVTQQQPLYTGEPLIQPRGHDHLMLRVSDVRKSAAMWQRLFGVGGRERKGVIWLQQGNQRIGLRPLQGNETPGVDYFAIRAAKFDAQVVAKGLARLDATGISQDRDLGGVFFSDIDGLRVKIVQS